MSHNGPILFKTPQTIIGPKQEVSGFQIILATRLTYNWNQEKQNKIHKIPLYGLWLNWRFKYVPLWMRPLALHIGPYGDVLRTPGRFSGTFSGSNFAEWGYTTHFTELSFTFLQTFVYYARKHFFIQVFFFIKIFDVVMSSDLRDDKSQNKIAVAFFF